ncbi:hypothetical protein [Desulfocurvus sp. DL9XJH121]
MARVCCDNSRGYPLYDDTVIIEEAGVSAVAFQGNDPAWWNVTIDGQRYGFNAPEGRWSYGQEPPGALVIARIILGNAEDLPIGCILTQERLPQDKWRATIRGEAEGVSILADINARAKWQAFDVEDEHASLHIEEGDLSELNPKLVHLGPALLHWLREEREMMREKALAKPKPQNLPRQRLDPDEVRRRSAERARTRRAKKPTPEVLAAYDLVVSLLKPHLPEGMELEPRDLSKYFGVGIKGKGAWVCRLYYKTKNTAVELPDGEKLSLADWEELRKMIDKLLPHCGN